MSFTRSLFLTLAIATAFATSLDIVERAPTNQCCSSLISATSPAVAPILLLLGIVVPPIGQIGVCCKSISSTCADDWRVMFCCIYHAVSCAAVTPSVLGIDIGVGCTPLPPCPPCNTIGINTSDLFGANMGNAFNDLSAVAGNGTITTTTAPSIQTIFVRHGSVCQVPRTDSKGKVRGSEPEVGDRRSESEVSEWAWLQLVRCALPNAQGPICGAESERSSDGVKQR
ncbi:hypothetical protein R3P38DRAFT_3193040 [Favolaschia claudopus]|uniref:Hydrophobin n=1 Tax=Favolaschia claudopus TaxID=2862362 RepID=A0AAW0BMB7_9AGAR